MISRLMLMTLSLAACVPATGPAEDGGSATPDASVEPPRDAGQVPFDAGTPLLDAGTPLFDAGTPVLDAGTPALDAGATPDAGTPAVDAGVAGQFSYAIIDAGTLYVDGKAFAYQLLRFDVVGKPASYGQYFPPPDGGTGPVILVTQPYAGAGWTGEEVDRRWAAKAPYYALYPDTDSPGFDGGDSIIYQPMSVDDGATQSFIYLYHGVGVLHVFARFYAGGSIENDVDDIVAGFRFLEQAPTVAKGKIGLFGGSWGGFEAVYGAMRAPASVRPTVTTALYPLTDFEVQEHFLTHLNEKFSSPGQIATISTFFAPYRRRIHATTDSQGFSRWRASAVRAELQSPTAILHDEWDVLVPSEETVALTDAGVPVDAFMLRHLGTPAWDSYGLKHFPIDSEEPNNDSAIITFTVVHLLLPLTPPTMTLYVPVERAKLHAFILAQRVAQRSGDTLPAFARQLRELTDPRVYVFEPGFALTGADWVTAEVNSVWGTSFTSTTIRAQLALGLPAP